MRSFPVRIALAFSLVFPISVSAQDLDALRSSTPQERATFQTEYMKDKLALTAEQLPKVSSLNLETAQKIQPVLESSDRPLMKARAVKGIEAQKETALQGILTPDQFQKFLALREEMKQKLEQKLADKAAGKTP